MSQSLPLFPESASSSAAQVDYLALALLGITLFFSLGIACTLVYFTARYWHAREAPRGRHISNRAHWIIESTWIAIPLAILIAMFVWGAKVYVSAHEPPDDSLEIYVVGKQWMWKIAHPEGRREINELHIPLGQPIRLTMISEDVIHSFYVPEFRVKQDVVPGRYSTLWFEPTKPGRFHLFCAEYCGTSHAKMIGEVVVMPPEDYADWLEGSEDEQPSLAQEGEAIMQEVGCNQCHDPQDGNHQGPELLTLYNQMVELDRGGWVRADQEYIRRSILEPASEGRLGFAKTMPSYEGKLSAEQIVAITAYLKEQATQPRSDERSLVTATDDLSLTNANDTTSHP